MDQSRDKSLRETFAEARAKREQLGESDPQSNLYKDLLQSILQDFEWCQQTISGVSIFSTNEDLEDLSTQSIQYLTVDYLIAELLQRSYSSQRLAALRRISSLLEDFLMRLDQYSILPPEDRKLLEQYNETKPNFSILPTNLEDRRRVKIKRFQEEKELKKKLDVCSLPFVN